MEIFFKSLRDWKKNPNKYKGIPKPPKYKKKNSCNLIIYPIVKIDKNQLLQLSKNIKLKIPTGLNFDYKNKINQVRVIPKLDKFRIEVIYTKETKTKNYNNNYVAIDLGVNNLITMVSCNKQPIIIDGKYFKSQIYYRNYKLAELQRIKDKCKKNTKYILFKNKIQKLHSKCKRKLKSKLHLVSKRIINYLKENNIDNLVIGQNKDWKQKSKLSKKVNQSFVGIPFNTLI